MKILKEKTPHKYLILNSRDELHPILTLMGKNVPLMAEPVLTFLASSKDFL